MGLRFALFTRTVVDVSADGAVTGYSPWTITENRKSRKKLTKLVTKMECDTSCWCIVPYDTDTMNGGRLETILNTSGKVFNKALAEAAANTLAMDEVDHFLPQITKTVRRVKAYGPVNEALDRVGYEQALSDLLEAMQEAAGDQIEPHPLAGFTLEQLGKFAEYISSFKGVE